MAAGVDVHEDPRIVRSRALILDAARACFAEHGYEQATVDDVAARAGIAKRTIYNIYGDKESLFRAAIAVSIDTAEAFTRHFQDRIAALADLDRDLPDLARRLARDVITGPVIPLRRLVARESARFPDLAARYFDRAPGAVIRALAVGFADLGARGILAVPDAAQAAHHFAYLVLGPELDRRMFEDTPRALARLERDAAAAAEAFLRAYRP
jgi:TetR/AcrR family transcriptional regulator, mexJK operon transcriptional repressor